VPERASKLRFDPKVFLTTVDGGRSSSTFQKDAVIFARGDAADAVFYVQDGKVKMTVVSEQGKEAVVAIVQTGEFLGEGCLIGQPLRLASARAMSESVVLRVEKAEMVRILHPEPTFR
jgi:CRP/FNR family cyclic AMP-dependent transcriptional regulator